MKKAISRTLCLIFIVIMIVPIASSCGKDKAIYSLGEYEITEKEYNYLFGMFKKKVLVSMGGDLSDEDMLQEISEGITLADYLEARYRDGFEQSVLALLLSQAIFDELGLSLTDEELSTINATATAMVAYFGNYSEKEFNNKAKDYGFDDDAMRSVYEMQFKENKVRDYYLGVNNEKVTDENRESYYRENMKLLDDENLDALFEPSPIYTKIRDDNPTRYIGNSKVKNTMVADGCVIEGEVENCILFRGVKIGKGAVVKNSIIMQDTTIRDNAQIDYVITDKEVTVSEGRSLKGNSSFPVFVPAYKII